MMHQVLQGEDAPEPIRAGDRVSVAASAYRCFPGETLTLCVQALAERDLSEVALTLSVPAGLDIHPHAQSLLSGAPRIETDAAGRQRVVWRGLQLLAHVSAVFEISARVQFEGWEWKEAEYQRRLQVECSMTWPAMPADPLRDGVSVTVLRQSDLVRYLPGIYQGGASLAMAQNDFIWRFLMLFERLWEPIEDRIEHIDRYFDRTIAPPFMLPWLAWGLAFMLDESWDEQKCRRVLGEMARLYRMRGTRKGLKALLALYFDEQPSIFDVASRLKLGAVSRLGQNTALGDRSRPHHFTVAFRRSLSDSEQALARALIAANAPAHTEFDLQMTPLASPVATAQPAA